MLKRFRSIFIVTCAVLLSSSTHVSAAALRSVEISITEPSNLVVRSQRGAFVPGTPVSPTSTSEPGDDDAPNKDGNIGTGTPVLDGDKGNGTIRLWSFKNLGTGIRLHLLKWFSALR